MSKPWLPKQFEEFYQKTAGSIMSVGEYLEHLRANPGWKDFPIVSRELGLVVSKPRDHQLSVALLGVCHDLKHNGESLEGRGSEYWELADCICGVNLLYKEHVIEVFIRTGGYYFSRSTSDSFHYSPRMVCLNGRHMDETDHEIYDCLRCVDVDHRY